MDEWEEVQFGPEEWAIQRAYRLKRGPSWCYLHLHRLPDGSWDAILYDQVTRMLDHDHADTPSEAQLWARKRLAAMFAE
jgi:hypothetical protein